MTPKEALRFMGRYIPCDHSDTATVGYGDTKCLECGRIWPKGEDVTYASYNRFIEAYDVLIDTITRLNVLEGQLGDANTRVERLKDRVLSLGGDYVDICGGREEVGMTREEWESRPQPDARIIPSVYIGSGGTVIAGGSMDTLQYIREEGDD